MDHYLCKFLPIPCLSSLSPPAPPPPPFPFFTPFLLLFLLLFLPWTYFLVMSKSFSPYCYYNSYSALYCSFLPLCRIVSIDLFKILVSFTCFTGLFLYLHNRFLSSIILFLTVRICFLYRVSFLIFSFWSWFFFLIFKIINMYFLLIIECH